MSEASHEAGFHGIGNPHHDDRDGPGGVLGCFRRRRIDGHDYVDFEPQKLFDQSPKPLVMPGRVPQLYRDAASLDVAELTKLVAKRLQQPRLQVLGQNADSAD